jgi:hypothetical protein
MRVQKLMNLEQRCAHPYVPIGLTVSAGSHAETADTSTGRADTVQRQASRSEEEQRRK